MVMHRALFTWFMLLVFFILLCLRLENRTQWNWFLIFLPMWIYDMILLIDALFNIFIGIKHNRSIFKNKNVLLVLIVLLKIAAQIILCLKLEYHSLNLTLYNVFIPVWILLPIVVIDVSITLFKNDY